MTYTIGNHIPPKVTQDTPLDNTSGYIREQVAVFVRLGKTISTDIARAIAAQYQTPNNAYTAFASTGTLTTPEFDENDEPTRWEKERPLILDDIDKDLDNLLLSYERPHLLALQNYITTLCDEQNITWSE